MPGGAFVHGFQIEDIQLPNVLFGFSYDFVSTASTAAVASGGTINDGGTVTVLQSDSATQMQGKLASAVVADVAAKYPGAVCSKVVGMGIFVL